MLNVLRERLRPTSTMRVYDAVSDSGIDVSDWHNISSSRSPALPPQGLLSVGFDGRGRVLLRLCYNTLGSLAAERDRGLQWQRGGETVARDVLIDQKINFAIFDLSRRLLYCADRDT